MVQTKISLVKQKLEFQLINELEFRGGKNRSLADVFREKIKTTKDQKIDIITGYIKKSGFEEVFGKNWQNSTHLLKRFNNIIIGEYSPDIIDFVDELHDALASKEIENERSLKINIGNNDNGILINLDENELNTHKYSEYDDMIHSKIFAINLDSEKNFIYIGSANITSKALAKKNAECGIIIENANETLRKKVRAYFDHILSKKSTAIYRPEDMIKYCHLRQFTKTKIGMSYAHKENIQIVYVYHPQLKDDRIYPNHKIRTIIPENLNLSNSINNVFLLAMFDQFEFKPIKNLPS